MFVVYKIIDMAFKSKNGTILAVCAKSFMRLISDTVSASDVVEIPITFMVNLRRFINGHVLFLTIQMHREPL
jgi:hypothetical protein